MYRTEQHVIRQLATTSGQAVGRVHIRRDFPNPENKRKRKPLLTGSGLNTSLAMVFFQGRAVSVSQLGTLLIHRPRHAWTLLVVVVLACGLVSPALLCGCARGESHADGEQNQDCEDCVFRIHLLDDFRVSSVVQGRVGNAAGFSRHSEVFCAFPCVCTLTCPCTPFPCGCCRHPFQALRFGGCPCRWQVAPLRIVFSLVMFICMLVQREYKYAALFHSDSTIDLWADLRAGSSILASVSTQHIRSLFPNPEFHFSGLRISNRIC